MIEYSPEQKIHHNK